MKAPKPGHVGVDRSAQAPTGAASTTRSVEGRSPMSAALDWLRAHGGEPPAWARLTGETAFDHGLALLSILEEHRTDEMTRMLAVLACAREAPDSAFLQGSVGREDAAALEPLIGHARRVLALSAAADSGPARAATLEQAENVRRLTLALAVDLRVVLVKLSSGLHGLRRLVLLRRSMGVELPDGSSLAGDDAAVHRVATEARTVLAPLASRLGLYGFKWEIEDLAFRLSEPDEYQWLARQLELRRVQRVELIASARDRLVVALREEGIAATVNGRAKHLYSIWRKISAKGRSIDAIHDLLALRIIVGTIEQCYASLDVVHRLWTPLMSEFDDYIARPKPNGYRSLHTVVSVDAGPSLEVQIRTREMHEYAESGVAAHWRYKEVGSALPASGDNDWLMQMMARDRDLNGLQPEGERVGETGRIFVLSPQGRIVELPDGGTPIDFAYSIHTGLGHRCRGARVDGRLVPLNTPLRNGQVVEIIAAKPGLESRAGPSRDWLNASQAYFASPRTRSKIRHWFSQLEREAEQAKGREIVERAISREGRGSTLSLLQLANALGHESVEQLFTAIAQERIGPRALEDAVRNTGVHRDPSGAGSAGSAQRVASEGNQGATATGSQSDPSLQADVEEVLRSASHAGSRAATGSAGHGVLVLGVDFLMTQLARCCHPIPGDRIVGFVTRGKGVSVHRANCSSFHALEARSPERVMQASWGQSEGRYPVAIQVQGSDRHGLLRDVADVLARDRIGLRSVRSQSRGDSVRFQFVAEVTDGSELSKILGTIASLRGVHSAARA